MQASLNDDAVQHPGLVETVHDHEPVDDFASTADRKAMRRTHQRNHVAINVGSEAAIEFELGPASRLAAGERREIEIGEMNRLFQLVNPIAGKKYLRHVSLTTGDFGHRRPIGVAPQQEFALVSERQIGRRKRLRLWAGWVLLDQHESRIWPVEAERQVDHATTSSAPVQPTSNPFQPDLSAVELVKNAFVH